MDSKQEVRQAYETLANYMRQRTDDTTDWHEVSLNEREEPNCVEVYVDEDGDPNEQQERVQSAAQNLGVYELASTVRVIPTERAELYAESQVIA